MSHELELNKANRLRLARAFRHHRRVDYAIDCVVEGQMGWAFADDQHQPTAFVIAIPPFYYFAGDANSPGAQTLLRKLPPYGLLMPSPPDWLAAANHLFPSLEVFTRYNFTSDGLSQTHLTTLLHNSPYCDRVVPLDASLLERWVAQPENDLSIEAFDSPADFLERGLGFTVLDGEQMLGIAYSSLVCSQGIEVSLYVKERHRERGVATALACQLLLTCLHQGMRPNWDAANLESYKLAQKLGYTFAGAYEAYYHSAR